MGRTGKTPEFFATMIRKVESAGGNAVRVYFATERAGAWDDQFTLVVPIEAAITGSRFLIEAASEIFDEMHGKAGETAARERSH